MMPDIIFAESVSEFIKMNFLFISGKDIVGHPIIYFIPSNLDFDDIDE